MNRTSKIMLVATIGLVWYNHRQKKNDRPKVRYVEWLPFNLNGLMLPPFGIFIKKEHRGNKNLVLHELVHWKQYQREGLLGFLLGYAKEQSKGYDNNRYEIEARYMETDFCRSNYTYCVRNGLSRTVNNKNFRK